MKITRLNTVFYSMLLLNIAVLNGVSQGDSGFWGAPFMDAARRWLSTTQSLPHSTSQQDAGMAEILRDIGETARVRIQEAEQQRELEAGNRDSQETATFPQEADQTGAELPQAHTEQNSVQTLIEQRDEALRQAEPTLRREEPGLVHTIAQQYFSRIISLDDLADPAGPLDHVVSSLTVNTRIGSANRNRRITREQIQQIGLRYPYVRELVLARAGLGNEELRTLSEQPFAPNLTSLNIAGNDINSAGLSALSTFTSLTRLDVSDNNITGLQILSEQSFARNLTMLNISGNDITVEGLSAIGAFASLTSLDISYNRIGDAGLRILSEQSFASQLTTLYISGTAITLDGLPLLNKFTMLKELGIAGHELRNEGLAVLAEQPIAQQLTGLDINNNDITAEGIQHLRSFPQLRKLNISNNDIRSAGLEVLAQLPIASQLTSLGINSTGIVPELNSLRAFAGLTVLSIARNYLGNEGLRIISELPYARNLVELDMSNNDVSRLSSEKYKKVFSSLKKYNNVLLKN